MLAILIRTGKESDLRVLKKECSGNKPMKNHYNVGKKRSNFINGVTKKSLKKIYQTTDSVLDEIGKRFNCSDSTIRERLISFGIPLKKERYFPINIDSIKEILDGDLLSDGSLSKGTKNAIFYHNTSQLEYLKLLRKQLKILKFGRIQLKKSKKRYTSYASASMTNSTLTALYLKWYPEGKKIIPPDLKLTPTVCLYWYLGDGCYARRKTTNHIKLSTDGFRLADLKAVIIPQLISKGFKPRLWRVKPGQYVIGFIREDIPKFLDYIGKCPVKCYQYKWGDKK